MINHFVALFDSLRAQQGHSRAAFFLTFCNCSLMQLEFVSLYHLMKAYILFVTLHLSRFPSDEYINIDFTEIKHNS